MENRIDELIELHGDYDRLVLRWLCHRAGEPAVRRAAIKLAASGSRNRPGLPAVCRALGLRPRGRPPCSSRRSAPSRDVGDRYLNQIRRILGAPAEARDEAGAGHATGDAANHAGDAASEPRADGGSRDGAQASLPLQARAA